MARNLVEKGAVKYTDGTVLRISAFTPSSREDASGFVEISEIPPCMTRHKLISFLQNKKRSDGGRIADIQYDELNRMALVAFEDQKGNKIYIINTLSVDVIVEISNSWCLWCINFFIKVFTCYVSHNFSNFRTSYPVC